MGAVLLRLLGHQADIGDAAHGGRIKGAMLLAILDHLLIDGGIAAVRHHGNGVVQLIVRPPHPTAVPDKDRHRGIDDHVVGDMQVGDPLAGVHHGQFAVGLINRLDVGLDGRPLGLGQFSDLGVQIAQAVVDVHPQLFDDRGVFFENILIEDRDAMTEHDRVRDLHHGGLQVQGQQDARPFWPPRSARRKTSAAPRHSSPKHRGSRLPAGAASP